MKYFVAAVIGVVLALPAFAFEGPVGMPNENGCGLGSFPLVRWGRQQDRQLPPMFVWFDFDHDDDGAMREGRSDTGQMLRHESCVENK